MSVDHLYMNLVPVLGIVSVDLGLALLFAFFVFSYVIIFIIYYYNNMF